MAYFRTVDTIDLDPLRATEAIGFSFILAYVTYRCIEQPFAKDKQLKLPYFTIGAASISFLSVIGFILYASEGFPKRFSPQARNLFAAASDYNRLRPKCHYSGAGQPTPYNKNCVLGAAGVQADVAVWGDSHGAELAVVLADRAISSGRAVMEITSSACPPSLDFKIPERPNCPERNHSSLVGLISDRYIKTVVVSVNAENYADREALYKGLRASMVELIAAHKQVVLVKQIPIMPLDPPAQAGLYLDRKYDLSKIGSSARSFHRKSERYDHFAELAATSLNIETYDPATMICDTETCHAYSTDTGVMYFDQNHLSVAGAAKVFAPLVDEIYDK